MEMIDWVTCKIPFFFKGSLNDGQVINFTKDGEIKYLIDKKLNVEGSYSSNIQIRTEELDENANTVEIFLSGNPVKFLQGHNFFGTSDLLNLMYELILDLSCKLGAPQPENTLKQIRDGFYTITKIDINRMYSLINRAEVTSFLTFMASNSRTRSQSAVMKIEKIKGSIHKSPTVYLNKTSKRWSVKLYGKGQEAELSRNRKSGGFICPPELKKWLDDKIRIELTLHSNELKETGLDSASEWRNIEESDVFTNYVKRIQMASQKKIDNISDKIKSSSVRSTYTHWLNGVDTQKLLARNTFYRHRRALLEYDIDISILNLVKEETPSNVVPLCKILELKPAEFPHWVSGTEFLFEPRKVC